MLCLEIKLKKKYRTARTSESRASTESPMSVVGEFLVGFVVLSDAAPKDAADRHIESERECAGEDRPHENRTRG